MRELDLQNLSEEDKAWMRSRNMPIPEDQLDEDEEGGAQEEVTPPVIQKTAANDGVKDTPPDYSDWPNDALRAELDERDLPTKGNKAELVARLQEDDEAESEDEDESDEE